MQAYETSMRQGDTRLVLKPDTSFFRFFNDPSGVMNGTTTAAPTPPAGAPAPAAARAAAPAPTPAAATPAPATEAAPAR